MYSVKRSYAALHYLGCIRILVVIYSRVKDESGNPRIKLKRFFLMPRCDGLVERARDVLGAVHRSEGIRR